MAGSSTSLRVASYYCPIERWMSRLRTLPAGLKSTPERGAMRCFFRRILALEPEARTSVPPLVASTLGVEVTGEAIAPVEAGYLQYAAGVGAYREVCDEIAADNYRGFNFA